MPNEPAGARATRSASRWFALLLVLAARGIPARAEGKVGDGHPENCTPSAFTTAVNAGGNVTFDCGPAPHTIVMNAPIVIAIGATVDGGGSVTLSGGTLTRLFVVNPGGVLVLRNLTISDASAAADGGAVVNFGSLYIDHCTFERNVADASHSGGAIYSQGSLAIAQSTFRQNSAGNGGALYAKFSASDTRIADSTFTGNQTTNATVGWGGAILAWDGAKVTIDRSVFDHNTARHGGAIYVLANSNVTARDSQVTGNTADNGTAGGNAGGGILNAGTLTLERVTLDSNSVADAHAGATDDPRGGGGVANLAGATATVTGGAISANAGRYGGGIMNLGTLTVTGATLVGNHAGVGGALLNTAATAAVAASTLSANSVSLADFPTVGTAVGSAISNRQAVLTLTNTTVSGNGATGVGAVTNSNGMETLVNTTVAANGAIGLAEEQAPNTSQVALTNTLLAGNAASDCGQLPPNQFTSQFGLSGDASCLWTGAGNRVATDALLGPLADNGGGTQTHVPGVGSPAVDGGTATGCPAADQRSVSRPDGPACDVGAVEVTASDRATTSTTLVACASAATFESVHCRLEAVVAVAEAAQGPGRRLRRKLVALLTAADGAVSRAADASPRRTKRLLAAAERKIRRAMHAGAKPSVGDQVRTVVAGVLPGVVADVVALEGD